MPSKEEFHAQVATDPYFHEGMQVDTKESPSHSRTSFLIQVTLSVAIRADQDTQRYH